MCGFAGFVDFGSTNTFDPLMRQSILRAMGSSMERRGPDEETYYDDGVLSLVFRRLTVIGTKDDGQPMLSRAGTTLMVCNGEIYNHKELRRELGSSYQFKTKSDCEVVLHGYEEWGTQVASRLNGMFAAALWSRNQRRLFLLRDRLGIKPLYVCEIDNGVLFGSELKALLNHPKCPCDFDWDAFNADKPLSLRNAPSFVKGVSFVPGGSWCIVSGERGLRVKQYWNIDDYLGTDPLGSTASLYQERYDELIQVATVEHLPGHGAIGIHLSGGVDSTLLASIIASQKREAVCFSIVERSSLQVGDVDAARDVAAKFNLPWHPVLFDYRTLMQDLGFNLQKLEESVWMMDSPQFDLEWIIKGELNRAIRTMYPDLKILMLGQGADEFAGGYSNRADVQTSNWEQYIAAEVGYIVSMYKGLERNSFKGHAYSILNGLRRGIGPYHYFMKLMVRQLQQHNLWHEDRTSSAYGMEARVPFLDHRLVELLASVPAKLHQPLFWQKTIVRNCLQRRYPEYNIVRPKVGFLYTQDRRSLDIIMQSMVCAVGRGFTEKYVDDPRFPYDRSETVEWIDKVIKRAPGFYQLTTRVLSRMAAAIFNQRLLCTDVPAFNLVTPREVSHLEIISTERWKTLNQELSAEPLVSFPWRKKHKLFLHANTKIEFRGDDDMQTECSLVVGSTTYATIGFSSKFSWIVTFLENLSNDENQGKTVDWWLTHLNCSNIAMMECLNLLLQSGFLAMPTLSADENETLGSLLMPL